MAYIDQFTPPNSTVVYDIKDTSSGFVAADATTASHGLMSAADKIKLNGIAAGAEVNVQSNWTQTSSSADDFIKNKPTLGTASSKSYTTSVTSGSEDLVTSGAVYTAIDNLPEPMIFKGSVGDSGTITWANLPAPAATNEGFTYKVITARTTSQTSTLTQDVKVGDTIISNKTNWVVIPSGDEPSGTVTSITLKAGTGISLDVDNTAITTSGTRTITNSGVRSVTINGNNLRVNTNGTNADLTIPYATSAGSATKATQDGNGNTITSTYLPLSGGTLTGNLSVTNVLGINQTSGTAGGISLYSGTNYVDNYGICFRTTSNKGKHGYVQSDWATYFTMDGAETRGWVCRHTSNGNVASISGQGNLVLNGSVTIGGNATNTSGARMEYNSTLNCIDFVFN